MYIITYNDVYIVIMHNNLLSQIINDIFLRNVAYNRNNNFMTSWPESRKKTDSTSLWHYLLNYNHTTPCKKSCDFVNHRSLIIISPWSYTDSRWLRARSTLPYTLLIRFRGVTYGRCNDNGPANARNRGALKSLYNYCHYRRDCADEAARRYDCDVDAWNVTLTRASASQILRHI